MFLKDSSSFTELLLRRKRERGPNTSLGFSSRPVWQSLQKEEGRGTHHRPYKQEKQVYRRPQTVESTKTKRSSWNDSKRTQVVVGRETPDWCKIGSLDLLRSDEFTGWTSAMSDPFLERGRDNRKFQRERKSERVCVYVEKRDLRFVLEKLLESEDFCTSRQLNFVADKSHDVLSTSVLLPFPLLTLCLDPRPIHPRR